MKSNVVIHQKQPYASPRSSTGTVSSGYAESGYHTDPEREYYDSRASPEQYGAPSSTMAQYSQQQAVRVYSDQNEAAKYGRRNEFAVQDPYDPSRTYETRRTTEPTGQRYEISGGPPRNEVGYRRVTVTTSNGQQIVVENTGLYRQREDVVDPNRKYQ
ncbi:MAG: hypothetical protein M1824_002828 [Vezdaea acicularis]|nr:MAG: hypothetical protein M1824_002828 [Vezdaea acicularis]